METVIFEIKTNIEYFLNTEKSQCNKANMLTRKKKVFQGPWHLNAINGIQMALRAHGGICAT